MTPRVPARSFLHDLLALAQRRAADRIYITPGAPPALRRRGAVVSVSQTVLTPRHTATLVRSVLDTSQRERFASGAETRLPLAVDGVGEFEVTAFHHRGQPAMRLRPLPPPALDFDELGLQPVLDRMRQRGHGLLLVASVRPRLRDAAIELLTQRLPGLAVQAAAIGFVDEAEDRATLDRALAAAQDGPCVLAVAADAVVPMLRSLSLQVSEAHRVDGCAGLAAALGAALALHPLGGAGPGPDPVAMECLLATPQAAADIAAADWSALEETMKRRPGPGTRTLDRHLFELFARGRIGREQALGQARNADELGREIGLQTRPATTRPVLATPAPAAPLEPAVVADDRPEGTGTGMPIPTPPPASRIAAGADAVQFRAYVPEAIAPGAAKLVDIWACRPEQAAEVARLAASTARLSGLRAGVPLERGTLVSVRLHIEGLRVRPSAQSLLWDGEPANVTFAVSAPAGAGHGPRAARARLFAAGVAIGELNFLVSIAAQSGTTALYDVGARPALYRSAFASYAAEDRADVLARIQGMKKVAPELDVFVDALGLRSGERWQQRIETEVTARDRLFLFWSAHARESPWVDFEWRLAQRKKGLDAIDPVPLVDPRTALPPRELAALHFGAAYVEYIAGGKALAAPGPDAAA